jgi:hypothetical protein
MKTDLDAFESKLLAELRAHVVERSTADGRGDEPPRHVAGPRLVLVSAGAAAAIAVAVIAAVLVGPGLRSSPAYSVDEGSAGQIHVEVNRPEDAAGLQRALEEHGVAADITYLPGLQTCAPDRYTAVNRKHVGMMTSIGERFISVTLPSGTVRDGETFVLTWSVQPMSAREIKAAMEAHDASSGPGIVGAGFGTTASIDIATGPVKPCQPVSVTAP